ASTLPQRERGRRERRGASLRVMSALGAIQRLESPLVFGNSSCRQTTVGDVGDRAGLPMDERGPNQYALTSAASTSTLTACPIRSTESTRRAFGASLRISRPMTPFSGP